MDEESAMTQLKDDIRQLCEVYLAYRPVPLRVLDVISALLFNAARFKGIFDAQGIVTVDDEMRHLVERTTALSRKATEQALNRREVENGTSR